MGAFDAVGGCLRCSDLCVFKGVVHPLSLGQRWLLLIITECSSVSQPLIRIYWAHTSHRKLMESHGEFETAHKMYDNILQLLQKILPLAETFLI